MESPDRSALYELAAGQEGYFTTRQAEAVGYSRPLLDHHLKSGRIRRARRGVYRLVEFPSGEHEDLVVAWLWSDRAGVFSHDTALALHNLSDALPAHLHLTLPASWSKRRLRVPEGARVHFADVPERERGWSGAVPVTSPPRTIRDCAADHLPPDILAQAVRDGTARGLFTAAEAIDFGVDR
jgi:predicted transcriptional regulator of viral defense system